MQLLVKDHSSQMTPLSRVTLHRVEVVTSSPTHLEWGVEGHLRRGTERVSDPVLATDCHWSTVLSDPREGTVGLVGVDTTGDVVTRVGRGRGTGPTIVKTGRVKDGTQGLPEVRF